MSENLNADKTPTSLLSNAVAQQSLLANNRPSAMFPTIISLPLLFCLSDTLAMAYQVDPVTDKKLLAEGPHWDPLTQNLFFVDDFASSIHRYSPADGRETSCKIDDSAAVSIVIPVKGHTNKFAVTVGRNLTIVTWDGETPTPTHIQHIATVDDDHPDSHNNVFNDGKADPTGRLWIGTMGPIAPDGRWTPEKGSLYSFPKGSAPRRHLDRLSISNGLIWSRDATRMFYIDSPTRRIDVFDFDPALGTISNRRLFFDVHPHISSKDGGPDGMTIDSEDNLWFAIFGEGAVLNVNGTTGELIRRVEVPCKQTTSVAFGGAELDELYVTSASLEVGPGAGEGASEQLGRVFRVRGLGVKGRPGVAADL